MHDLVKNGKVRQNKHTKITETYSTTQYILLLPSLRLVYLCLETIMSLIEKEQQIRSNPWVLTR